MVGNRLQDLPAVKLDDDLAVAVVVDLLELADVACSTLCQHEMSRLIKRASFSKASEDV